MRGLFVTGTDTGVGKTVLSAALLAAINADGETVRAYKPAVTGLDEPSETGWPADHELLGAAAGIAAEQVSPLRYGPAVSPLLAAELAGEPLTAETLVSTSSAVVREAQQAQATLIVEGVGGLLSPLGENFTVCDLAVSLRLPLLLAARPGLGTINHTLLTLQSARAAGLDVRAVVLTPWPEQPSRLEQSNLETIRRFGFVELDTLAHASSPDVSELARIGAALPWRRWLGDSLAAPEPAL
ncbi:MAG TPA: dethiobiotin synthase [Solirubrobacteraceae bacterium]|jgi:dethiobiotin synthetase